MAREHGRYQAIASDLRSRIADGTYPPGTWLPPQRQLAAHYKVAVGTVGHALDELEGEGRVRQIHGSGTLVLEPPVPEPTNTEIMAIVREIQADVAALKLGTVRAATVPERQPVVAAIVTSGEAVLITRRQDGKPPWAFVGGEIDQGESPADAGVREVKEETGLEVTAGHEIGRRIHPATGRTMIYMACQPAGRSTRVFVGDERELAEVKWVSLDEARSLMPGLYGPVDAYLEQVTRGAA